ncbi:PorV/PorQ family protein [candidate division KSB1 bacterium]|nr:PorV/PorQ family protein [candidate division KSB1 bacterium]
MKRVLITITLILFTTTHSFAISKVGTTAAQFLKIGAGARAIGMGSAFVAVANDVSAVYWNPAGVARLDNNEVVLLHTEWLADVSYDFLAASINMGNMGAIGFSITSVSMDEMEVRTELEPEGTGEFFDAGDIAASLCWSRNLTDRFSIGFNAKYIRQKIWHMSASGFAVDVGTMFTTQFNGMRIGMSITNFGPNMKMSGRDARDYIDVNPNAIGSNDQIPAYLSMDSWSLPITFRVGAAMDAYKDPHNCLTIALDALHPNDNSESVNFGLEYGFQDWAFIRLGWQSLFLPDDERGSFLGGSGSGEAYPTNAGVGFSYSFNPNLKIKLDYAYADFGRLENTQRFSLGIEF